MDTKIIIENLKYLELENNENTKAYVMRWERQYEWNVETQMLINIGEEKLNVNELSTQLNKLAKEQQKKFMKVER